MIYFKLSRAMIPGNSDGIDYWQFYLAGLIVAHSHPAGSISPSPEDLETTEKLIRAGELLEISLVDHAIVTASDLCSLRETRSYLRP